VLKVTNGLVEGRIWIQNGEVIDAEALDLKAEPAFQRILSWKTGSFELLPADANRVRAIFTSYQGLLLNTAQALDEEAAAQEATEVAEADESFSAEGGKPTTLLAEVSQIHGVEFVLALQTNGSAKNAQLDFWGLENPKPMAEWTRETLEVFRALGEELQVGQLQEIVGTGPQRKVALGGCGASKLCVGFASSLPAEQLRETMKGIVSKWAS
jgi:hypothetical protein